MIGSMPTIFVDDADPAVVWPVTDTSGANLDFTLTNTIGIDGGAYNTTGTWLGTAAPTRNLRVPLTLAGLTADKAHAVYLKVPSGADFRLGWFYLATRA